MSDNQITLESGFLHLLEPTDEILADRGFLIRDELAVYGATLHITKFNERKESVTCL